MTTNRDLMNDELQMAVKKIYPGLSTDSSNSITYAITDLLDALEQMQETVDELNKEEITSLKDDRQKFIDRFGEDPVDVLGDDWENYIEDYIKNANDEDERIDK